MGIFGLMDQPKQVQKSSSYVIKNPYDATRDAITSIKNTANLIVVLSSLSKEMNVTLLKEFPDIDFIISTDKQRRAPTRVKDAYILSSGDKGKYLGNLDISLNSSERPLGLKDIGRKRKLESTLSWTKRSISQLKQTQDAILKTDKAQLGEKFSQELDRLNKTENRYREELAKLANVRNYFENRLIPLASKRPAEMIRLSGKTARNGGRATQTISPGPHHIRIITAGKDKGGNVTFVLLIDKSPNRVRALGFDVVYDPKAMNYSGYTKGELVKSFDLFDASKLKEGLLRLGGIEAGGDLIRPGMSGGLVGLTFEVIGKGELKIHVTGLKDDISSWMVEGPQLSGKTTRKITGD